MPITLDPITIANRPEDDPDRLADERAQLTDQAVVDALRALQVPAMPAPGRPGEAADAIAQATDGGAPPYAQTPGGAVHPSGAVSFPGAPQTRQTIADFQRDRDGGEPATAPSATPRPSVVLPREDEITITRPGSAPSVVLPREDEITITRPDRAPVQEEPAARPQSPTFRMPAIDPMIIDDARRAPERERVRQEVLDHRAALARKPQPSVATPSPLDEGLPSDADIRGARERDVLRGVAGALGNAFIGYSGRGAMVQPRREAEELQRRREQGLRVARAEKRQAVHDDDQRRRLDLQEERQTRLDALATAREERQARVADAQLAYHQARTEQERASALALLRHEDPGSFESGRARDRYVLAVMERERLRPESQRRSAADIAGEVRGLSAADIEALERRLGSVTYGTRTSRAGSGTGGGGAVAPGRGGGAAALDMTRLDQAVERGLISEENAEALRADLQSRDRRVREAAADRLDAYAPPGVQLLPGVTATVDLEPGEARTFRQDFTRASSRYGALNNIARIGRQYGLSGAMSITREAESQLAAEIASMRAIYAAVQNTGVINPSEAPLIEAQIPNPTNLRQMTMGELENRVNSFRRYLEREIVAGLRGWGVDEAGVRAALALLHSGGDASVSVAPAGGRSRSSSSARVPVINLVTGQRGTLPADQVDDALRTGRFRRAD